MLVTTGEGVITSPDVHVAAPAGSGHVNVYNPSALVIVTSSSRSAVCAGSSATSITTLPPSPEAKARKPDRIVI
jgi:hypothetical protein